MLSGILYVAGGLGLFLLGMSVMTDGLKSIADEKLRQVLARSTRSPLSGFLTGALTTALIQSSSATTVAAVGLVHVGLLTFSESLGIIFGANLGTTVTGWLIALLGFKLKLGELMLPVILGGALVRVMGRGVVRSAGTAVAGFGLIFVGISALQQGMAALEGVITPSSFPPDTLSGRLLLLAIGIALTVITQSSSAGVAAALAAVHAGTISVHQAAAMVIGMDIGTSTTAAMATIGGNVQARRTGFAHVLYNFFTATCATVLLEPYYYVLQWMSPGFESSNPEIALVSFHTTYNLVCVMLILPFTRKYARFVEWLFPEHGNPLTKRLDTNLLRSPDIALQAVSATMEEINQQLLQAIAPTLANPRRVIPSERLEDIEEAVSRTREFLESLHVRTDVPNQIDQYTNSIHILDQLERMIRRAQDRARLARIRDDGELTLMSEVLLETFRMLAQTSFPVPAEVGSKIHRNNHELKVAMRRYRVNSLKRAASGEVPAKFALQRMDAARTIRRLGYHAWRIANHAAEGQFERKV
jgi:phosphate:Na+ symporter